MSGSGNTYIACRLCDNVFLSTKALINHLDSHIVNEEDIVRVRKQLQISHLMSSQKSNPFSNPLIQHGPANTTATLIPFHPSPQIHPYSDHSKQFYTPFQLPALPPLPPLSPLPPLPYSQRNAADIQPNPNPRPNQHTYSSGARDLSLGLGSGFGEHSSVPLSKQTALRQAAAKDFRGLRPFLSLLDYRIPQMMNNNCNGNSDDEQMDLTLKL